MDKPKPVCGIAALAVALGFGAAVAAAPPAVAATGDSSSAAADSRSVPPGRGPSTATRTAPRTKHVSPATAGGIGRTGRPDVPSGRATGASGSAENAIAWIRTYVDPPWLGVIPRVVNSIVNNPPVATPIQAEVDLAQGITSQAIPFTAVSRRGRAITYVVPDQGMPGGPARGTVTVDNAAGTFTYTAGESFTGTDTFAFVASNAPSTGIRVIDDLIGSLVNLLGLSWGFRDTSTVSIFNGVPIQPDSDVAVYTAITGSFSALTYDVAGLLTGMPNALEIGSRFNTFDIVNVQGGAAVGGFLSAAASFPDQTSPSSILSGGLSTFSAYDIDDLQRVMWNGCTVICLGAGGFDYMRLGIPGGESIDLYNVDTNSGLPLSIADIEQLSSFIQQNSIGRAVIVQGDFNQLYSATGETLTEFSADNGLTDAWVQLEYNGITPTNAPTCAYGSSCEQPGKIFYRSADPLSLDDPASSPVQLFAQTYTNEGLNFRNSNDKELSNGIPQAVTFGYSVAAVGPVNVDPENWMAKLPGISELPLTQLPIPGTHDSGSYGITSRSEWAATGRSDFGDLTQLAPIIEDLIVKPIAAAWGRTQGLSFSQQFANGIRYVDLRFSNEPDGQIYIEHGLRGPTAQDVVGQIAEFADAHPKEVLFVQVSRLTNFDADANAALVSMMEDAFGSRMVPRSIGTSASLADIWAIDKNVIVIYEDDGVVAGNPDLWASGSIYQPWWNVQTMDDLYLQNQAGLASRPPGSIWGLTGEATPDSSNIVAGILLLGPMSNYGFITRSQPTLEKWLSSDFKTAVNLVTEDWFQQMGSTPSSYARDVMAAVYETLAPRMLEARAAAIAADRSAG